MAQTHIGGMRVLAEKAGLPLSLLLTNHALGLKWCYRCKDWKSKIVAFQLDSSRWDSACPLCKDCKHVLHKLRYTPKPKVDRRGRRFVVVRDGDKEQARRRVNHLVQVGLLPNPNELPCVDCSHIGSDRRHEYDHYLGYSCAYQEDVQSVCSKCHSRRAWGRGEMDRDEHRKAMVKNGLKRRRDTCRLGHPITLMRDGKRRCHTCRIAYWRSYNKNRTGGAERLRKERSGRHG